MAGVDNYKRALSKTASSRDTEYRLLAQVTSALINAQKADGDMKKNPKKMKMIAESLNRNNEVWQAFMDDCRESSNKLPEKLRGGILSLAIWVGKETKLAMDGTNNLDMLITINRDIMKGLSAVAPNNSSIKIPGGSQNLPPRKNNKTIKTI
jgi:flagellar protein FlaF